jgi:uncharacterized protein (DUF2062 family)
VLFRVNRASALVGCLITNTWISFVTFVLAVKVGALMFGLNWREVNESCSGIFHHFSLARLAELDEVVFAVAAGYLLVSLIIGVAVYLVSLALITIFRKKAIPVD